MVAASLPFYINQLVTREGKQGIYRVLGYHKEGSSLKVLLADVTDMFHPQPILANVWGELKDASHLDV